MKAVFICLQLIVLIKLFIADSFNIKPKLKYDIKHFQKRVLFFV